SVPMPGPLRPSPPGLRPPGRALLGGLAWLAMLLVALAGCRPGPSPPPAPAPAGPVWFEDVSASLGLDFHHDAGPGEDYRLPLIMGSGGAFLDANGDGLLDVYLVHNGGPKGKRNQLFLQQKDGTFKDSSTGSGLDVAGFGMGVAVGDFDNDGWVDVYVSQYE